MRRRSRAGSNPGKSRRRKAVTSKRRSAPEFVDAGSASVVGQETEVGRLTRERDEALEQQKAAAEGLKIMSTSPTELQPVMHVLVTRASRFCRTDEGR